jgi:hypothetical protein
VSNVAESALYLHCTARIDGASQDNVLAKSVSAPDISFRLQLTGMLKQSESIRAVKAFVVVVLVDVVMKSLDTVKSVMDSHGVPVARAVGKLDQVVVMGELVHVRPLETDVDVSQQRLPFFFDLWPGRAQEVVGLVRVGGSVRRVDGAQLESLSLVLDHIAGRS